MGDGGVIAKVISIHAPLTGSDYRVYSAYCDSAISIHAPLTGSDGYRSTLCYREGNFNPRSPYGERRGMRPIDADGLPFQSTLPLRGATRHAQYGRKGAYISIHAPLTGSDRRNHPPRELDTYFNPRSPYGERPEKNYNVSPSRRFQSLPLKFKGKYVAVYTRFSSKLKTKTT